MPKGRYVKRQRDELIIEDRRNSIKFDALDYNGHNGNDDSQYHETFGRENITFVNNSQDFLQSESDINGIYNDGPDGIQPLQGEIEERNEETLSNDQQQQGKFYFIQYISKRLLE